MSKSNYYFNYSEPAFTLIEIIIVIAIIAILAAVAILAINPSQNFIDSRNTARQNEAKEIESAVNQWIVDGNSLDSITQQGNGEPMIGCAYGTNGVAKTSGLDASIDLNALLVDGSTQYLPEIPSDPRATSSVDTGFDICRYGERVIVTAPQAEDNAVIAVPAPYSESSAMNSTIGLTGSDVDLSWDDVSMPSYEVWRGTYAYFEPGDSFSTLLTTTASTSYTDTTAAVGNTSTNHFYIIVGKNANGKVTYVSDRTGEFDYALTPGNPGSPKYTTIGIPLETTQFSTAAEAADAFGGADDVEQVLRYVSSTGTFLAWFEKTSDGDNFNINLGDKLYVMLDESGDSNFTLYGQVPAQGSIQYSFTNGQYTDLIVPLEKISVTTANGLATDIAGSLSNVGQVLYFNPATQSNSSYFSGSPPFLNFSVKAGYPYSVLANSNTPETWP